MKSTSHAHLHVTAISDQGRQRQNNEDRYAVSAHLAGPANNIRSLFAVVCDGIGGHQAGEIAAEIAVELISSFVAQSDGAQPLDILTRAISLASDAIYAESLKDLNRKGMGATCVCVWVLGDQLYTASLGDSRLFLIRDGNIQQLTKDHTWVQEALDAGILTPESARSHPNVHMIRRYLGAPEYVTPDLHLRLKPGESDEESLSNQGLQLMVGDILALCSDGLTDLVQPAEIQEIVSKHGREEGAHALVELANQRGGHDNTTLVMLEVPSNAAGDQIKISEHSHQAKPRVSSKILLGCAIAAILVVLIAAIVVGGGIWYLNQNAPKQPTPSVTAEASVAPLPIQKDFATPRPEFDQPLVTLLAPTITPWPTNVP